jgi:hypothetical protein
MSSWGKVVAERGGGPGAAATADVVPQLARNSAMDRHVNQFTMAGVAVYMSIPISVDVDAVLRDVAVLVSRRLTRTSALSSRGDALDVFGGYLVARAFFIATGRSAGLTVEADRVTNSSCIAQKRPLFIVSYYGLICPRTKFSTRHAAMRAATGLWHGHF